MSSIASPRGSLAIQSPTSNSTRSSLSQDRAPHTAPPQRRNRTALRDYYGLKDTSAAPDTAASPAPPSPLVQPEESPPVPSSEIDRADYDPDAYVTRLLQSEGLEKVLRVESGLVGDIRGLDGEKKALVYDNYSKLIDATDTIRRMRGDMEPMAPMTESLEGRVNGIAEKAERLGRGLRGRADGKQDEEGKESGVDETRRRQVETVKWVLDAPSRLRTLVQGGKRAEAEGDWAEVKHLLNMWTGVQGVDEVRKRCENALAAG